jgi:hypothetical protein
MWSKLTSQKGGDVYVNFSTVCYFERSVDSHGFPANGTDITVVNENVVMVTETPQEVARIIEELIDSHHPFRA